jgi:hypothetical protein
MVHPERQVPATSETNVHRSPASSFSNILITVSQMGNLLRTASALLSSPLLDNELNYFIQIH